MMLVKTSAITDETREHMNTVLEEVFAHKEGEGIQSVVSEVLNDKDVFLYLLTYLKTNQVVSEVLNDKDVFLYLLTYLKTNQGVELGRMSYWDDIRVEVPYGIAVDQRSYHPKLTIFEYSSVMGSADELGFYPFLPRRHGTFAYEDFPTPKNFSDAVNLVLKNPKGSLVDLNRIKKGITY